MQWFKALMNPPFGSVQIDDHIYFGTEVVIDGDNVFLDGVKQSQVVTQRTLKVAVIGDIAELHTVSGNVDTSGDVGSVHTVSGSVKCGDVGGDIKTVSGSVSAGNVNGNIDTLSGSVRRK
ncbi:hypothetical protein [Pseudomonas sp. P8_250]|uniref:hypothetical protein n=1 Tax=Pseudomonas sp. P8_250 TaxID=3043446 RepID=UPI002A35C558|nr:hypothetical protein [Pseudomonas sp. P8_250]MDX9668683.1 hypothetical protein [Pseudomonas sp. P8_250]